MDKTIKEIIQILDDTQGENIKVIDISKVSGFTDYFIIVTANSDPHMSALRDKILELLEKSNENVIYYDKGKGYDWLVVDCGYFMIHIFKKEARELYSLETLWLNGIEVDISSLKTI